MAVINEWLWIRWIAARRAGKWMTAWKGVVICLTDCVPTTATATSVFNREAYNCIYIHVYLCEYMNSAVDDDMYNKSYI